eukprot:m.101788 g.101788  ORF g.101788 m.101788 type:complete len:930 (+) comp10408_c0_seq1:140-2929(+)
MVAVVAVLYAIIVNARPHFLFYMADDLGHLWPEGTGIAMQPSQHITHAEARDIMPNFERVRAEGAIFTRAYTATPICAPARFTVLTGRYCSTSPHARTTADRGSVVYVDNVACNFVWKRLAKRRWQKRKQVVARQRQTSLSASQSHAQSNSIMIESDSDDNSLTPIPTMPQQLASAGYRTILSGKWHLTASTSVGGNYSDLVASIKEAGFTDVVAAYATNIMDHPTISHNPEWCTAQANDAMSRVIDLNENFFLYFTPTLPHSPDAFVALKNFSDRVTPAGVLEASPISGFTLSRRDIITHVHRVVGMGPQFSGRSLEHRRSRVAGLIGCDQALGSLLNHLTKLGQLDNTVVVVTSDHGKSYKGTLAAEPGIRVPLFVRYPRIFPRGSRVDALVTSLDHAPTFYALAGMTNTEVALTHGQSWSTIETHTATKSSTSRSHDNPTTLTPAVIASSMAVERCLVFEMRTERAVLCAFVDGHHLKLIATPSMDNGFCPVEPLVLVDVDDDATGSTNLIHNPVYTRYAVRLNTILACHVRATDPFAPTDGDMDCTAMSNRDNDDMEGRLSTLSLRRQPWMSQLVPPFQRPPAAKYVAAAQRLRVHAWDPATFYATNPALQCATRRDRHSGNTTRRPSRHGYVVTAGARPYHTHHRLGEPTTAASALACRAVCDATPQCASFTFSQSQAACSVYAPLPTEEVRMDAFTKHSGPPRVGSAAGGDYYRRLVCTSRCSTEPTDGLVEFRGKIPHASTLHVLEMATPTVAACADACRTSPLACVAFTWSHQPRRGANANGNGDGTVTGGNTNTVTTTDGGGGTCMFYRERMDATDLVDAHIPTMSFYHLPTCTPPCPRTALGMFWEAKGLSPARCFGVWGCMVIQIICSALVRRRNIDVAPHGQHCRHCLSVSALIVMLTVYVHTDTTNLFVAFLTLLF